MPFLVRLPLPVVMVPLTVVLPEPPKTRFRLVPVMELAALRVSVSASVWMEVSPGSPEIVTVPAQVFEPLMLHWQSADGTIDGLESWPAFRDRVQQGLKHITQRPGRGRRVVAFTSGGFIATATHLVLGAPARSALEMSWRIRNGALTEFLFTGERMTLDSFNSVAHFADPELLTYR